jgi:signal transduction protein with GAF and PtsI domain
VIQAQGYEQEIPVGYSVPVGKGIVGHVARTGIPENISDVYEDPRFNIDLDK